MARKALVILVLAALLLSLVPSAAACIFGGGGSGAADMIDMMKKVPEDMEFLMLLDINAVRTDDDLKAIYEDEDFQRTYSEHFLDIEDIDRVGFGSVVLYEGEFDLDDVREWLESNGYDEEEYKDVEIWEWEDWYSRSVALMSGLIIAGEIDDVKDCIDVIEEGEDSLYDDRDIKDVVDRLPDGFMASVGYSSSGLYWHYDDIEATGTSMAKHDSDSFEVTWIVKFEAEATVEDTIDGIRQDMENDELRNINVTRDGQFVKATFEVDIEDMLSDDTFDGDDDDATHASGDVDDLEIMNHSSYLGEYGEYHHVYGEVKNNGSNNLTSVLLTATFYDSSDSVIGCDDFVLTEIDILTPGQRSPFHSCMWYGEDTSAAVDHYTVVVSSCDVTTTEPYREFEVLSDTSSSDSWIDYRVTGEVQNTGSEDAEFAEVVGTFYDSSGVVVATGKGYVHADVFAAGQVALFDILLLDESQAALIDSYDLQVQCSD